MTIPASAIVQINPGVIGGGGAALALNGLILTNNIAVPIGTVQPFPSAAAVSTFFGPASTEAALATIYFNGFDNSTAKPGNLLFSQYAAAPVAAYLRSGSLASMTLTQLQALTGTVIVTVDGTLKTSSSINLSAATSFSNAATIIAAAFTTGPTVTFDSVRSAFVITSTTTGATSTMTFATGTLSTALNLTQATGAVLSQGAIASVPGTAMSAITNVTLNWAAFMTTFEPVIADKLSFASWTNGQNKRFVYVAWDTDANAIVANNTTALGPQLNASNSDGTVPISGDASVAAALGVTLASLVMNHAAFVLGSIASVNFAQTNGRITFAFKGQSGLVAAVGNQTVGANLDVNGYNFYGAYATANQGFVFFYPGSVTGSYAFLDEYINQVYLNSQFQLALMTLLTTVTSIPYNPQGYSLIDGACMDPINAGLNFGSIRTNVPLSALQIAEVNNAAGVKIDTVLSSRGWYLQILPATAQVRAARGTPPISFWYMDGGAIQNIVMASIVIQ
ncbi:DUF3383 family protein [Collimonas pratensis]|uniref:DUF3383 domain-containing protein n=1 Tax=Collimonas pratensis TaxID=279113 RepID=UPI00143DC0C8|nr:DUF3383 domain-containing protein [Collimonas pratensis]NKI68961.1 DUF3383 family protein [Collimonas pratensis]